MLPLPPTSTLFPYTTLFRSRGTHRFYQRSMNQEINDRRQIEMDLREALENNELELHYQPIIDLQRNTVTGFERSEEHTSELQSRVDLVCRLLLEKKKKTKRL